MKRTANLVFISFCLVFASCATTSRFDQNTYNAAIKIKSDAVNLIADAIDPASAHSLEIQHIKTELSSQLAYEEGKGASNLISYKQWQIITSDESLLGQFLKEWESGARKYNKPFLIEKAQNISDAFDQILKLEAAKPLE